MKKIIILLITILFITILVSCGGSEKSSSSTLPEPQIKVDPSQPGWEQDDREVTFDWYINFPWYTGNWGQDVVTQYVTELTGVSINFIVPAGDANQKLNTLVASDSLPDIITLGFYEDVAKLIQNPKLVYNLEELAEAYDPYFLEVTSEDARNWYRQEDGGVYGYPNASMTLADFDDPDNNVSIDSFMVRKDIYEAIGSPNMSTPEGFLAALKAAKEQFPEVEGQSLIPLGLGEFNGGGNTLLGYLQNFLAIPDEKDGKLYDRTTDPEYVTWLKAVRKANELGLISTDIFSDTRRQIEEKITQGRYFALLYPYNDALWPLTQRYNENKDSSYISIQGPQNSNGDEPQLRGGGISGWTITLISKNNKDPEKAIRFLEFIFSPKGKEVAFLGKQGVTWDMIDGRAQFLPDIDKLRNEDRGEFDKKYGADWLLWMGLDNVYQAKHWPTPIPDAYRQQKEWTRGKSIPRFHLENIDPLGSSDLGVSYSKYNGKFMELLSKMILAESDEKFDALLQEYVDYREEHSYDAVQEYRNSKMQENKQKLGIE